MVHFAAESHVDRSIHGPADFVQTNVVGTFTLLEAARAYWSALDEADKASVPLSARVDRRGVRLAVRDRSAILRRPRRTRRTSPYSATKAAFRPSGARLSSYVRPAGTHHELLEQLRPVPVPRETDSADDRQRARRQAAAGLRRRQNVRDWLYVGDHCSAIREVLARGTPGETYNVGGWNEKNESRRRPHAVRSARSSCVRRRAASYRDQITFVKDRPGHDRRYAIDARKLERELGWKPAETFETGLAKTVRWYLDNQEWSDEVASGDYRKWVETNYAQRA